MHSPIASGTVDFPLFLRTRYLARRHETKHAGEKVIASTGIRTRDLLILSHVLPTGPSAPLAERPPVMCAAVHVPIIPAAAMVQEPAP